MDENLEESRPVRSKRFIGNVLRAIPISLFNQLPVVSGILREQAFSFANYLGISSYDKISGYNSELALQDNMSSHLADYNLFKWSHIGSALGLVFDVATIYAAVSHNDLISSEIHQYARDLLNLKLQTNLASLGLLTLLKAVGKPEKRLEERVD